MEKISKLISISEVRQIVSGVKEGKKENTKEPEHTNYYTYSLRGINIEMQSKQYKITNLNEKQKNEVNKFLQSNDFFKLEYGKDRIIIPVNQGAQDDIQELVRGYKDLIELIEDADLDTLGKKRSPVYDDKVAKETDKFYSAAFAYKTVIKKGIGHLIMSNHRKFLHADTQDDEITEGISLLAKKDKKHTHREHVVPCIVISEHVVSMVQNNESLEKIADFIKTHLKIVIIHKTEAQLLDVEMGYRESMPKNWSIGDNIYERLKLAKIEFELNKLSIVNQMSEQTHKSRKDL